MNFLRVNEVYGEMKDEGFEFDVVIYGIIINAHCKAKKHDEVIRFFNEMEMRSCKLSFYIFCSLINGFGFERRLN